MAFHDDWYPKAQLDNLVRICEYTKPLKGAVVEIGCWEGKSTVALANTCFPETLIAVDSWEGNLGEGPNHVTVELLKQRDVYGDFVENVRTLTRGNVKIERADCFEFIAGLGEPIKFCHVDASHDYASVKRTLEMLAPMIVEGGIICGDDYISANKHRVDLDGGVERACNEVHPDHYSAGNFWFWRKAA
jgi:predicted O-methyltransferase YrrM